MATITESIGTSARDYSTVAAWEAGISADLVTDGDSYVGEMYNDSEFSTSSSTTIDGHTTGASNTITLTTAAGEGFADSLDISTGALRYDQSNGVGWDYTSAFTACLTVKDLYVTIDGLQIKCSGTGTVADCISNNSSGNYGTVKNCILEPIEHGIYGAGTTGLVYENIAIYCRKAGGVGIAYWNATVQNCIVVSDTGVTSTATGINRLGGSGSSTIKNVASLGFNTCFATGTGITISYCASTDTSASGTGSLTSRTITDEVTDPTGSVYDLRYKSGNSLEDAGTTGSSTDMFGTTWGTTDIGPYDAPSGGGPTDAYVWWQIIN